MIALEIIQRVWSLIPPPASDGSITVHEFDTSPDGATNARLTIDHQGQRHLLIPADSNRKPVEDKRSSGIHLQSAEWGDDSTRRRFVNLVCLKPHLNGLFDLIIYEVLAEIIQTDVQADRVCQTVLNRWRELLAHDTVPMPERSTIIGLFGELTIMRRLAHINPLSLPVWIGPEGGRFDFFAGVYSVEVKTTLRRQGIHLIIHGYDQLDPSPNINLYLAVVLIEETPAAGENLSMQIEALATLGVNRAEIYRKVARVGFTPDVLEMLNDQRFTFVEQQLYLVNDDFPRITASSFAAGKLPRGVIGLNYMIDLSVPPPHPLNETDSLAVIKSLAESAV